MKKFMLKNKKALIIGGVVLALAGVGYASMSYRNFNKDSLKAPDQPQGLKEESKTRDDKNTKGTETQSIPSEKPKSNYLITKLNKKDGDIFSIPDEVTFTVSPTVDKSRLTLTGADGAVLYTEETTSGEAKFTVYPEKKVADGSQGTLLIEGVVGADVVVFQKIKVVF